MDTVELLCGKSKIEIDIIILPDSAPTPSFMIEQPLYLNQQNWVREELIACRVRRRRRLDGLPSLQRNCRNARPPPYPTYPTQQPSELRIRLCCAMQSVVCTGAIRPPRQYSRQLRRSGTTPTTAPDVVYWEPAINESQHGSLGSSCSEVQTIITTIVSQAGLFPRTEHREVQKLILLHDLIAADYAAAVYLGLNPRPYVDCHRSCFDHPLLGLSLHGIGE